MDLTLIVVILYATLLLALAVYGVNFFYLTFVAPRIRSTLHEQPLPDCLPLVTVQLPIFNEHLVAERIIEAAARLDWPLDRLEIQVLDDSTDVTRDIVAGAVSRWQTAGINIQHIQRVQRTGYKAGALAAGLSLARGEFVTIFDADFVPAPDFLRRTIGAFRDPSIGFVQARWVYLNRETSLLTYLQSLSLDGHLVIEQTARAGKGYVINFNGTAGVWRRSAIEAAGGWNTETLAEDLDLSYRAALKGWKSSYLPDVTVPSELVNDLSAYLSQQSRWIQGGIECARRLIPDIIRSQLSRPAKTEAILHLTCSCIQFLLLVASLVYPFFLTIRLTPDWQIALSVMGTLLLPTALAPALLFLTAQRMQQRRRSLREISGLLALSILWSGMVLNSVAALWRGLHTGHGVFDRTPKLGTIGKQPPPKVITHQRRDGLIFVNFLLASWNIYTAILSWQWRVPGIFINAVISTVGLLWIALSIFSETHTQLNWPRMQLPKLEPDRIGTQPP